MPASESYHQPLRMLDANLNRSSEGLRVLEDIARFSLNDARLSQQLRAMRHQLRRRSEPLSIKLLSQRNSPGDVGVSKAKKPQKNLAGVVRANAMRVEESLRVIEELARTPKLRGLLDPVELEGNRFALYSIEQELFSLLLRRDKAKQLRGLYAILDLQVLAGRDAIKASREIIAAGVSAIQLRDKKGGKRELLPLARELGALCTAANILFIVNDHLDLALASGADGIHLGQKDMPISAMRREMPVDKIIGCTINTVEQAVRAQQDGADYISLGAIFPTGTKEGAIVIGTERLKEVREAISAPLVAIGGITGDNVNEVMATGADCVAVSSAILCQDDIGAAAALLLKKISAPEEKCQDR